MSKPFNFAIPRAKFREDGKRIRPCSNAGSMNRRVVVDKTIDGVEYRYHATKGWRVKRLEMHPRSRAQYQLGIDLRAHRTVTP